MLKSIIYGLVDPRTLLVHYVGKSSSGLERPRQHARERSLKSGFPSASWINELHAAGLTYQIVVLESVKDPKEKGSWCCWWNADRKPTRLKEAERWWIAFGRACGWPLTNATDGGEGLLEPSQRTREKLSKAAIARMASPEVRENLRAKTKARMNMPEARARASEVAKALWSSPEARAATSARAKAVANTPEGRARSKLFGEYSKDPRVRAKLGARTRARFEDAEVRSAHGAKVSARMSTPEEKARQSALTTARLASAEARALHGQRIKAGMEASGAVSKLSGENNPAKRPEVRQKMSEAARRRFALVDEAERKAWRARMDETKRRG